MLTTLGLAFALMLVLEGLMPFLAPAAWRDMFRRVMELSDGQIRFIGLAAILIGLGLFWIIS
ncbi:MAG: DUF2065 domain-containing protein [Burkholderiaceae bacterium]|jgi:uncharacterized protein YjeT (DUF2065 family)|nr:DUF2065 domain-containing protein [Burkholderiaceae bacterium]